MRIYNISTNIINVIAGEMFNLEVNLYCYDLGVPIIGKHIAYPHYTLHKVNTWIRSNKGILFLPNNFGDENIDAIIAKLQDISKNYGKDHLARASSMDIDADHYTIFRAKNESAMRAVTSSVYKEPIPRTNARFTWYIYNFTDLMRHVDTYADMSNNLQLSGILYDPDRIFDFKHNQVIIQELSFTAMHSMKKFIDITYLGTPRQFFAKGTTHNIDNTAYKKYKRFHNYIYTHPHNKQIMMLCAIRKGGLEIIRLWGSSSVFENFRNYLPLYSIQQHVYKLDSSKCTLKSETCANCCVPLYDDIYVLFDTPDCISADDVKPVGTPICYVCMHSKPEESAPPLFASKTIGRLRVKTTHADIIDMLKTADIVKKILLASFVKTKLATSDPNRVLVLGEPAAYIAYDGSLSNYANTYNDTTDYPRELPLFISAIL
jgi:hypothetical protein